MINKFTRDLGGRSGFDKIISNRARLRFVACVMVHKAAKNAA